MLKVVQTLETSIGENGHIREAFRIRVRSLESSGQSSRNCLIELGVWGGDNFCDRTQWVALFRDEWKLALIAISDFRNMEYMNDYATTAFELKRRGRDTTYDDEWRLSVWDHRSNGRRSLTLNKGAWEKVATMLFGEIDKLVDVVAATGTTDCLKDHYGDDRGNYTSTGYSLNTTQTLNCKRSLE